MARDRAKITGRGDGSQSFSKLIHAYFQSPEYAALSPRAVKLLMDLYVQFRGTNNGNFCATWKFMQAVGWKSKDTLSKALKELLETGWLVVTRRGGRKIPTLYAVTFIPIDACGGRLDLRPTLTPLHSWKREGGSLRTAPVISLPRPTGQSAPPHGSEIKRRASI